jgi:hypothetical protein
LLRFFVGTIAVLLVVLVTLYLRNYRGKPWTAYAARPAWIRAGIYFCCCWLLSYASGGMDLIVHSPIATSAQLSDPKWIACTLGAYGFIFMAYSVVWVRYTVRFERPRKPLMSTVFGLLWGSSSGQLFLAVWLISNNIVGNERGAWILTFAVLAAWQPNFHNIYWDHYIAPEHDTPLTQRIKALGCHIPNLAITLTYLAAFDNYLIFVSFQVVACVSAAAGMRFPAPWATSNANDFAHRTDARIPRCTGYLPQDPKSDPYTPFYPGWKPREDVAV